MVDFCRPGHAHLQKQNTTITAEDISENITYCNLRSHG